MDENKLRSIHTFSLILLFLLLVVAGGFLWGAFSNASNLQAAEPSANGAIDKVPEYVPGASVKGKELFRANCQRCHMLDRKMTGPALMNVKDRWSDSTHLYSWVKNSQGFLQTGDKYANDLFKQYNSIMPAFPNLSEEDIREILYYADPE